jgi:hypothetical protein
LVVPSRLGFESQEARRRVPARRRRRGMGEVEILTVDS